MYGGGGVTSPYYVVITRKAVVANDNGLFMRSWSGAERPSSSSTARVTQVANGLLDINWI
jgi:hypothetical protein